MGHSQLEKQKTHDRIVEIASRRLREKGLEGIGVADLMKEAGLTVGGFYKHFASRDDMVAEAVKLAFGSWEATVRSAGRVPADISIAEFSARYLSEDHRGDVSGGCPFAALTADLARSGKACRSLATDQMKANLANMTDRMNAADEAEKRRKAIIVSCLMTGAVGLARVTDDPEFSEEILGAVRSFVTDFSVK